MQSLIADVSRQLGEAWTDTVEQIRDANTLAQIEDRIKAGDIVGAVTGIEEAAKDFVDAEHDAYGTAGDAAAEWLTTESGISVAYEPTNAYASTWAARNKLDLIREVTDEQRATLRAIHSAGVAAGRTPAQIAKEMHDSIGLTDAQTAIVENYRRALEAGDFSNALGRALSDGRSDRSVAAAQSNGKALTPAQVDTAVERYRSNWISYRAETIARTEGQRVAHQGTRDLMRHAISTGGIAADDLQREWNHAHGGTQSRSGHEAMNHQKRGLEEAFENPLTGARLQYPCDPDADPSETLNCRCCVSTRYVG